MRNQTTHTRLRRGALALTMALALSAGSSGIAYAAPLVGMTGVDISGQGTHDVRLSLAKGTDASGKPAAGDINAVTINLKRLSGINPTVRADLDKIERAELADVITWATDLHYSAETDSSGTVVFSDLPTGVYIVSSTPAAGKRELEPFLVAVPFYGTQGGHNAEGVIIAKSQGPDPQLPPRPNDPPRPSTPPQQPPTPPSTPPVANGNLAMTGAQVIGLVLAALVLVGAGIVLLLRGRNKSTEL